MIPTLKYLWLTCRHKCFVFKAGIKTGAPIWRLVIHDWTKFTPAEAPHYGRQFFGDKGDPDGFSRAWLHHQKNNPHHWEYWVPITGHNRGGCGDLQPLPMPDWAMREMVADWMGAGRAYEGEWPGREWPWLKANWPKIAPWIHPNTQRDICDLIWSLTRTKIGTMPIHNAIEQNKNKT